MKNVLAVIPARGGSKSVPNKNIIDICGKPLISYTIEAVKASRKITDHVISTDSEKIATLSRKLGGNVPFIRPSNLAKDDTPSIDVVFHALKQIEAETKKEYDVIIVLQPTNPMRTSNMIDLALNQLINSDFDSIISVVSVGANHPYRMYRIGENNKLIPFLNGIKNPTMPRQQLPSIYIRSGDIYAIERKCLFQQKSLIGKNPQAIIVEPEKTVNIDDYEDLILARIKMDKS